MNRTMKKTAVLLAAVLAAVELTNTWVPAYAAQDGGLLLDEAAEPVEAVVDAEEAGAEAVEAVTTPVADMPAEGTGSIKGTFADSEADLIYYESINPDEDGIPSIDGATPIQLAEGVTEEMCSPQFWNDKTAGSQLEADRLLITQEEINSLNTQMLASKDTYMYDLENMVDKYDAAKLKESLAAGTVPQRATLFVDGVSKDPAAYYKEVADAILATGYTETSRQNQYAVTVRRTTINNIPVNAYIGYTENDSDDEKASAALLVAEPFIIRQTATVFGDVFYWGYSDNCTGWVSANDLAICSDKAEWLDSWKIDVTGDDFIVVTQNQITLEPSVSMPELSQVKLTFATILKTVPEDKIPVSIAERGPWHNYVVYLPVRDADGKYVKRIALISQHYEVSRGFLEMTQAEVLRVAFNNLGDRYGWGGMLDSMDCSMLTRNVYRCFGLNLPRNTTWQQAVPGRKIDLSGMSDEAKLSAMNKMPAGTMFYLPGHTMIYTGTTLMNGKNMAYVISDSGSLSDTSGELNIRSMYGVIINPLSVRRKNGSTWLSNITAAVLPISQGCCDFVKQNIGTVEPQPQPVSGNRVPAAEGQVYASDKDTLPLETFLGNVQNIYISFYNVEGSGITELTATVIKGSKITTKMPVNAVRYVKGVASCSIKKSTGLATVTIKKSGVVSFDMADGKTYDVSFTVESPKARTAAVKQLVKEAKAASADLLTLSVNDLFGTAIDAGTLKIASQKSSSASVFDNSLILDPKVKNTIKLTYTYLNKKYSMTINVD
ncbi:MAG: C40 family peptidase [Lachnospiraceae bacterium]|nr:C40 family peptidase [Lachnospiraceae bacterium]